VVAGEDLLYLFRGELVPLDMEDVVIIPLETGNNYNVIVSCCIYETLRCWLPRASERVETAATA
jgi:hypothetical protein